MELYLKIWPFGNLFGARQAILHFDWLSLACLANEIKELQGDRQSWEKMVSILVYLCYTANLRRSWELITVGELIYQSSKIYSRV